MVITIHPDSFLTESIVDIVKELNDDIPLYEKLLALSIIHGIEIDALIETIAKHIVYTGEEWTSDLIKSGGA